MARARGLGCLASPLRGKASDAADSSRRRHSSAACICCIGPHHKPSAAAPDADLSARLPLTSCCGSGGDAVRGLGTPRTPRTPCTPTARRLCGVRSRTPRRGQVGCFPAPHAAAGPAHEGRRIGRPRRLAQCRRSAKRHRPSWHRRRAGEKHPWPRSALIACADPRNGSLFELVCKAVPRLEAAQRRGRWNGRC